MADNKLKGTFQFGANFEVTKADALDPRVRWDDWNQMIIKGNWPANGDTIYLYKGLVASVGNELWMLVDDTKFKGHLNTIGLQNLMVDSHGQPLYTTTKEISNFLGWKIIGGHDVEGHVLNMN